MTVSSFAHGTNPMAYWFIHLANSYRANDVMKAIHWKYGNNFSHLLSPSCFLVTTLTGMWG
ncbi:Uncharacterised protein [Pseudomonas aeruginosa]|nr:Uncharacterised protein [Pseudomonas aeruginosa]